MSARYPPYDIKGQVALVTGASAGFGEAIAWRLAELGCRLVLLARRGERLQQLAGRLAEEHGSEVHIVAMDVRDLDAIAALPSQLPDSFRQVDILVNNAGLALGTASVTDNSIEDMKTMLDTNVLSVMAMTKAFCGGMAQRNRGHIVNIGSTAGHESYPGGSGYCASKHALRAFTAAARHDLAAATGVRVTLISPGAAETEFSVVRFKGDEAKAAKVYEGFLPLNAQDVADNVVYALTRPPHVQVADLIVMSTHQAGAMHIARPLATQGQQ